MADKDYKSLLGKSSGSTWGELAGAYFSQNNKKSNRKRNILLASLFMNATEASMQSKVINNLEELDRKKTLEQARLTKQWEDREELQKEYEGVKDKTAYGYYKAAAETAFSDKFGDDPKYKLQAYQPEKIKWMKEWAGEKELDLNKRYGVGIIGYEGKGTSKPIYAKEGSGVDTDILTKEEFMQPLDDYYNAKRKDYLNPQNLSLVHKALGTIGFGTNRSEKTGNFLDKEGVDVVANFRQNKETNQERINKLTSQELAEIQMDNFKYDTSVKLTAGDFDTLLTETGMFQGTSEKQIRGRQIAYATWYPTNQSYDSAVASISNTIIGYDAAQTQRTLADVKNTYSVVNGPAPKEGLEKDKYKIDYETDLAAWKRGLQTETAAAFGMTEPLSVQRQNRAMAFFEVGLSAGIYKPEDMEKILLDILGEDLRVATGGIDYNQIKSDIIRETQLKNLTILQEDVYESNRAKIARARIKQINFIEDADKRLLKAQLSPDAYKSLQDVNFDMKKWNNKFRANTDNKDIAIINELQTSLWLQRGTSQAFIAGDAVVAALKKLTP